MSRFGCSLHCGRRRCIQCLRDERPEVSRKPALLATWPSALTGRQRLGTRYRPFLTLPVTNKRCTLSAMKTIIVGASIGVLLSPTAPAWAQASQPTSRAGEAFLVTQSYKTSDETSDGSSGSSSGSDTLLERSIARRPDGVEVEYDLPIDATREDRARNWQFPARVLRMDGGRMRLLNASQLDDRLAGWLETAKWDRSICGRWIFTWNAFRIECDPQSVIGRLEKMDLLSQDLRDGAPYLDARANGTGRLARQGGGSKGAIFSATVEVDPDKARLERANADVAVGEMTQKAIALRLHFVSGPRNRSQGLSQSSGRLTRPGFPRSGREPRPSRRSARTVRWKSELRLRCWSGGGCTSDALQW
jgi:hypothetical protein